MPTIDEGPPEDTPPLVVRVIMWAAALGLVGLIVLGLIGVTRMVFS